MIPVHNIYYMLSYAFRVLNEQGYRDVAAESFENVGELCAAILHKGVSIQLKRGLGREYVPRTEPLSTLRGRIDLAESVKTQSMLRKQLVCTYDEFSVNSYLNRILKTTMELLLLSDISKIRKKALRKLLVFFGDVETLDIHTIDWNIRYHRNNQSYRMLISICWLVVKGLVQTTKNGNFRLMGFLDEQRMYRLYERFILEYYRKEHPQLTVQAQQIPWQTDDGFTAMLPVMQTDITLQKGDRILIMDAKYYAHTTQVQYDVHTLHSANLYQIFTYVKNKEAQLAQQPHQISGMLLYARTDEAVQPDQVYRMSGNRISIRTLDLNMPFAQIRAQLDRIVEEHFG